MKFGIEGNIRYEIYTICVFWGIAIDKEKVMNDVCPKCGGQLIPKKGKYGAFIGCGNYPECRYTMKV